MYIDAPLPPMKVSFRDAKKMKGGSELAKKYSLNKFPDSTWPVKMSISFDLEPNVLAHIPEL